MRKVVRRKRGTKETHGALLRAVANYLGVRRWGNAQVYFERGGDGNTYYVTVLMVAKGRPRKFPVYAPIGGNRSGTVEANDAP